MELFNELKALNEPIFSIAAKPNTQTLHSHSVGQLSVPKNGILTLIVEGKLHIVPPQRAIFIPKNTLHAVYKVGPHTVLETVYFQEAYFPSLPKSLRTFQLSDLASTLITRLCQTPKENLNDSKANNILHVLLDELNEEQNPLHYEVFVPKSEDLLRLFDYLMQATDHLPSLMECAQLLHLSPRSLQRKLKQELNLSYILWRQQIVFAKSLALLVVHKKTSIVAYKLGYNSESAFIAMFKRLSDQQLPSQLASYR